MRDATKDWIHLARQDIQASHLLSKDDALASIAIFHAQQAVEKLLKALLEERERPVPKSHDLERLYRLVCNAWTLTVDEDDLRVLSNVYLESRYPFAAGLLPSRQPSPPEVRRLLQFTEDVERKVINLIDE